MMLAAKTLVLLLLIVAGSIGLTVGVVLWLTRREEPPRDTRSSLKRRPF